MKRKDFFIIFLGAVIPWMIYLIINDIIELANFIVTTCAFGAAIYAIYNQHQESKQAEEKFKKQFALQKEAALKQETIGAWQVLANKASGNSGKKEAIEFLASQGMPLCGIDMSSATHGGRVYLAGLFKDFKEEDRSKIDLIGAQFSEALLYKANFSGARLFEANFSEADLYEANFSGANLYMAKFSGASLSQVDLMVTNFFGHKPFDDKTFIDCYCYFDDYALPKPPPDYKFEFEERTDENNQPIYPENNPDYRYIKLKIK